MAVTTATRYQHLEPRPGSNYRQFFLKGRRIRAAVVYEAVHGPDPYTPEEFAADFGVPLEAVHEALEYVAENLPLIEAEREREAADVRARGLDRRCLSRVSFSSQPVTRTTAVVGNSQDVRATSSGDVVIQ